MTDFSNYPQCDTLTSDYKAAMGAYDAMMAAAAVFVAKGNVLAANSRFGVFSSAFRTWGAAVLPQIATFIQNSTPPPAP